VFDKNRKSRYRFPLRGKLLQYVQAYNHNYVERLKRKQREIYKLNINTL